MKCRSCGKEIEEGSEFCRYCGASQKKKRKPTWSERKKERERETAEIIKKSHLTEQDILLAVPTGTEGLTVRALGKTHAQFVRCALLAALYAVVTAAALAGLVLMMRFASDGLSRTLRAVICFALLLVLAGFGAAFADRFYSAGVFRKMDKSNRAVKKVSYGKAPYVTDGGELYQIICDAKCIACGAATHIEEFDGKLYVVCDYDRTHLCVLSTEEIFSVLLGKGECAGEAGSEAQENAADAGVCGETVTSESNSGETVTSESGSEEKSEDGEKAD